MFGFQTQTDTQRLISQSPMVPLTLTLPKPIHFSSFLTLKPPFLFRPSSSSSSSLSLSLSNFKPNRNLALYQRSVVGGRTVCRAELSHDAPVAAAIGACVLSSLFFPADGAREDGGDGGDGEGESAFDSDDSRLVVMAMISFIPYFNWLSWVFAWLDTGKRRYAVYSLVYLLPYIRSNLSLSPEESWLPIGSIICCIIHVQLETSIKNGDIQGFRLFSKASKHVSSASSKVSRRTSEEERKNKKMNLPSGDERSRNEIRGWGVPREPLRDGERLNEDKDEDGKRKHLNEDKDEDGKRKHLNEDKDEDGKRKR